MWGWGEIMSEELLHAQDMLKSWYEAEKAVAAAQSYRLGTRQITRANLSEIRQQIIYWRNEIGRLQGKGRRKIMRAVPRDL